MTAVDCGDCGRHLQDYCPCNEIPRIHQVFEHPEPVYDPVELGHHDHC